MEFKIKGTISGTRFDRKKVGDADKMVGSFRIEFIKGENRLVDFNQFLDLVDNGTVAIELKYFGKEQMDAFERVNLEAELKDMESDPKIKADKNAIAAVSETWKKRADLSVPELKSAINEIKNRLDSDKFQRERMEVIKCKKAFNKCAEAQKAMLAIEAEDKKKRLKADKLEAKLNKIEDILAKFGKPDEKKKKSGQQTLKPLPKGGRVPAGAN